MPNHTAYITGADRGLGLALTRVLLEKGYQVYAGQFLPEWPELEELKKKFPERLFIVPLDVASVQSVKKAAKEIANTTSFIDVLINNAAVYLEKRSGTILEELCFEDMLRTFDINALGPLRVTHSVINLIMKSTKKMIINISSEAASITNCWRKKEFGYAMSKVALNMQSAILQNHLKEYGVKVLAIHPGYLQTYMLGRKNLEADLRPEESAIKIYENFISQKFDLEGPIFYDYLGRELPW
ncbi:SDR family NAD(P)-dependent oxidoreductase [Atrimonas thermophila]|uniref:SDR family NAD(P)-dependent oxidoreductase n=1 Tax=Atrimonas thermophila TaxID=3064161 RepID=UPI00399D27B8